MDPRARRLLAMIALGGPHEAGQVTPAERRASFAKLMRFSAAPARPVSTRDLTMPCRRRPLALRLYTPEGVADESAGLVYFHGGGLVAGSLDTHDNLCRGLADAIGCRILAVDYRLAPEHPFPAAIVDALAATRWCLRHAPRLGMVPGAIGVAGDSGGATLAAVVAQVLGRRGRLKTQVLLCPVLDCGPPSVSRRAYAAGFLLDASTMAQDLSHYAPRRALSDPRLSPLRAANLSGLPRAVIHTAAFDPLVDEGAAYAARLAAAGTPVTYRCHASLVHHFYALDAMIPAAGTALAQIAADAREALTAATA
jgi:acetyl esterase/lipase